MRSKFFSILKALTFVVGAASLQACFYEHSYGPDYGSDPYAYGPGPAYAYGPAPYAYGPAPYTYGPPMGDYDDHREWHDRDWWVQNNHRWVEQHHHEWLEHHRDDDHEHHH